MLVANLLKMIGVKGAIVIVVALVVTIFIGIQKATILSYQNKVRSMNETIVNLQGTVVTLTADIKLQNDKITEMNKVKKDINRRLIGVNVKNSKLNEQFKTLKDKLNMKPIPATCAAAIKELTEQSNDMVKGWNKQ